MTKKMPDAYQYTDRDLSWLSFNYRVLQEAKDDRVPLLERLRFLAIYSSNLDEFFRVRVATWRSVVRMKKKTRKKLDVNPDKLLKTINKTVFAQQEEFGKIYRNDILPEMKKYGIELVGPEALTKGERKKVMKYFHQRVSPYVHPVFPGDSPPFLQNRQLYLLAVLKRKEARADLSYAILPIPTAELPRFYQIPSENSKNYRFIFLDDVIKAGASDIFPDYNIKGLYAIKLSRDADLNIEDEFSGDLKEKIKKRLKTREYGLPTRFLYDLNMPEKVRSEIRDYFQLDKYDMIPGGRYHNFHDFFTFPNPGQMLPEYPSKASLPHPLLKEGDSILQKVAEEDLLLYYPYQPFKHVIDFVDEAASNPDITSIRITIYRVAGDSGIVQALLKAARAGKEVLVFVEVKARFDEASNLYWAAEMERAGIQVMYSLPGIKVHTKLCVVSDRNRKHYAYIATGNFNEKTARIYGDLGLLTADQRISQEAYRVFEYLKGMDVEPFQHILLAPEWMENSFTALIDYEISEAKAGRKAGIRLKLNNLEDRDMINKLYEASQAGVPVQLIIRGICCLVPGIKGQSEHIAVRSLVGRYLEHARLYHFHHSGEDRLFIGSADWMSRNLKRRVELATPIYSERLKEELLYYWGLQWQDNVKSRIIDEELSNQYVPRKKGDVAVDAQKAWFTYLEQHRPQLSGSK